MAAKIFKNAMTVGLAVFLLSVALFMGMLYQYFGDQLTRELATEAAMVAQGVETTGRDYLDTLNVSSRVTWVDKDGTVLYDNRADPAQSDSLLRREAEAAVSVPVQVVLPLLREKLEGPHESASLLERAAKPFISHLDVEQIRLPPQLGRGMRIGIRDQVVAVERRKPPVHRRVGGKPRFERMNVRGQVLKAFPD